MTTSRRRGGDQAQPPPDNPRTDSAAAWMHAEYRRRLSGTPRTRRKEVAFDRGAYGEAALARARRAWSARLDGEREAALIYAALVPIASEAAAGAEVEVALLGMAMDKMRHVEICREVIAAVAVTGGTPPPVRGGSHMGRTDLPVEEQLLRHVIYNSCMVETLNAARLVDVTESASDPFVHEALRQLLGDEVHHADFGYQLLEQWLPWLDRRPEVVRSLGAFLARAFARLEKELSAAMPPRTHGREDVALGTPNPAHAAELFYRTVEEAVVPGLERFGLAARAAWTSRPNGN